MQLNLGQKIRELRQRDGRTREKWQLSDKLFEIATRAVSDDRANRQQTIRQFTAEWEAAQ